MDLAHGAAGLGALGALAQLGDRVHPDADPQTFSAADGSAPFQPLLMTNPAAPRMFIR